MHALFKGEVEHKMTSVRPDYFLCAFRSAPTFAPGMPAEILAPAAYSQRRSSHANSLCCAVSANSLKNLAVARADFDPDGFRGSRPTKPATQSGNADHSRTYPIAISLNRRKVSM